MMDAPFTINLSEEVDKETNKKVVHFKTWKAPKWLEDEYKDEIEGYRKWAEEGDGDDEE